MTIDRQTVVARLSKVRQAFNTDPLFSRLDRREIDDLVDAVLDLAGTRQRSDEDEIANPRCGCPMGTVRRVIVDHGTCGKGGCPYGGDL